MNIQRSITDHHGGKIPVQSFLNVQRLRCFWKDLIVSLEFPKLVGKELQKDSGNAELYHGFFRKKRSRSKHIGNYPFSSCKSIQTPRVLPKIHVFFAQQRKCSNARWAAVLTVQIPKSWREQWQRWSWSSYRPCLWKKSGDHQLRFVVYLIIYKLEIYPRWLFGIYEPSTNVPKLRPFSRDDGGSGGK